MSMIDREAFDYQQQLTSATSGSIVRRLEARGDRDRYGADRCRAVEAGTIGQFCMQTATRSPRMPDANPDLLRCHRSP
jgi:hypothetical protein